MRRFCGLCRTSSASASSRLRPVFATMRSRLSADEIGVGEARTDGVDGDAGRGGLERERAHEPDDGVLRGAIGADIRIPLQARRRGDGDDAPEAALGHRPEHRLRGVDHPQEIHVEHAPEELRVRLRERRRLRRPGVGDQEVDRPAVLGGDVGRHLDRGRIRHVGHQIAVRLAGRDGIAERARVAPDHRHPRPGAGQRFGDRKPDAAAAAGDERVSVSQRSHPRAASAADAANVACAREPTVRQRAKPKSPHAEVRSPKG